MLRKINRYAALSRASSQLTRQPWNIQMPADLLAKEYRMLERRCRVPQWNPWKVSPYEVFHRNAGCIEQVAGNKQQRDGLAAWSTTESGG